MEVAFPSSTGARTLGREKGGRHGETDALVLSAARPPASTRLMETRWVSERLPGEGQKVLVSALQGRWPAVEFPSFEHWRHVSETLDNGGHLDAGGGKEPMHRIFPLESFGHVSA